MCRAWTKINTIFIDDKLPTYHKKPRERIAILALMAVFVVHKLIRTRTHTHTNSLTHKYPMINKFHLAMLFSICLIVGG